MFQPIFQSSFLTRRFLAKAVLASTLLSVPLLTACSSADSAEANEVSAQAASAHAVMALAQQLPTLTGEHIWSVDNAASSLQFQAEHNGDVFIGNFGAFAAAIKLDLSDPSTGEIHALIDLSSIDAKDEDRNANLAGKDWFNMAQFPQAKYTAAEISGSREAGYTANGTLSIKGISRPVSLSFTVTETDGGMAIAEGYANFSRQIFELGTGSDFSTEDWVKFPIKVILNISASR